ncbi:hypothetical protein JD844_008928 [Phrynosoma platyrhinos]|uniref:Cysteine dioxygenase n=1 Tax=Phrynosoma platyrhinos TaxID=52577 RepID=A0ABQ7TFE6_PHRPL|nr:hypothetical protein JD844_008928 [Phrynosoma platyrhinos]
MAVLLAESEACPEEAPAPPALEDLVQALHHLFAAEKVNVAQITNINKNPVEDELEEHNNSGFDDQVEIYTRNLVDKGNEKFNLMILCWGEGHGSSIHDHTDSHCFMKILQGNLKETLFEWPDKKGVGEMQKKSERVLKKNQCAYINDTIGLHRVENPSHTETAVSLHLYSPPFESCYTFDQRTGHKQRVKMTFYSQFGERTPYTTSVSQENN